MADLDLQRLIDACDRYADRQHVLLDELVRYAGDPHSVTAQRAALDQLDVAVRDAHRALQTRLARRTRNEAAVDAAGYAPAYNRHLVDGR